MNRALANSIARHALGWLVAANAVGVVLSAFLVWPGLNTRLAPLTYGRWMPVHMNWHLYGWCAVPMIGLLASWLLPSENVRSARYARGALWVWTGALLAGGVAWLSGETSGKLFMDWSGWARPILPAAMMVWWTVFAEQVWLGRKRESGLALSAKTGVLLVLWAIPVVFFWAAGRELYPSVNPHSGGATGTALLGSTLALVAIVGAVPWALRLPKRTVRGRMAALFWGAFAVSVAVLLCIGHGHESHHASAQIVGLGLLLIWSPLSWLYFRTFQWPDGAKAWLGAAWVSWSVLLLSGWWEFLPGVSEQYKFTHLLVAHSHLAMAGAVTSLWGALLVVWGVGPRSKAIFWVWQTASWVHVFILIAMGIYETRDVAGFFLGSAVMTGLLIARLVVGLVLLAVSIVWWRSVRELKDTRIGGGL